MCVTNGQDKDVEQVQHLTLQEDKKRHKRHCIPLYNLFQFIFHFPVIKRGKVIAHKLLILLSVVEQQL